jgi:hypothetical protein
MRDYELRNSIAGQLTATDFAWGECMTNPRKISQPTLRRSLTMALFAGAGLLLGSQSAQAGEGSTITIDFDECIGGTSISTQYACDGVTTFAWANGAPTIYLYTGNNRLAPNPNANGNYKITLGQAATRVSVDVLAVELAGATLRGFNASNVLVASASTEASDAHLQIVGAGIVRIEIDAGLGEGWLIDNLSFDIAGRLAGCNPVVCAAVVDSDGDGTIDSEDGCPNDIAKIVAGICGCGVSDVDTDTDETVDCNDACVDDATKQLVGACGCGIPDTDTDSDETADCVDGCPGDVAKTAPGACGCGADDTDSDSDETADCNDACPSDSMKTRLGSCGCGVSDTDTDSDETADCLDGCPTDGLKTTPGVCGCGVANTDTDDDGTADCNDGCVDDGAKTSPGVCGCGMTEVDTDTDGTSDCVDLCPNDNPNDSDGDGVCNSEDPCSGNNSSGDSDDDGICDNLDDRASVQAEPFTGEQGSCSAGGVALLVGLDGDNSGELEPSEVTTTSYVCNGVLGNSALVSGENLEPESDECPSGGVRLSIGLDDDDDGELDAGEVGSDHVICGGQQSLVKLSALGPDPEGCPNGGARVDVGADSNADGVLDPDEHSATQTICNGQHSLVLTSTLSASEDDCPNGGFRTEAGIDTDGDGMLSESEVSSHADTCNGVGALARVHALASGNADCPAGGVRIDTGLDENANGTLDDGEAERGEPLCLNDSKVLLGGGKSSCSARAPGQRDTSSPLWAALTLLSVLGVCRRYRQRAV